MKKVGIFGFFKFSEEKTGKFVQNSVRSSQGFRENAKKLSKSVFKVAVRGSNKLNIWKFWAGKNCSRSQIVFSIVIL